MRELVFYTRAGCHLCEEMAVALASVLENTHVTTRIVDIDADTAHRETFDWRVPVLEYDGHIICEGRLDEDAVRDALNIR